MALGTDYRFNSEKAGKMKSDRDEPGSGKLIEMHWTFSQDFDDIVSMV